MGSSIVSWSSILCYKPSSIISGKTNIPRRGWDWIVTGLQVRRYCCKKNTKRRLCWWELSHYLQETSLTSNNPFGIVILEIKKHVKHWQEYKHKNDRSRKERMRVRKKTQIDFITFPWEDDKNLSLSASLGSSACAAKAFRAAWKYKQLGTRKTDYLSNRTRMERRVMTTQMSKGNLPRRT